MTDGLFYPELGHPTPVILYKMPYVIPYISHTNGGTARGQSFIITHNMSLVKPSPEKYFIFLSLLPLYIIILFASPTSLRFIECKNYSPVVLFMSIL